MKLSSYTIAKNCCDIADVSTGIMYLKEYLKRTANPKPTAYRRYAKLITLRSKLQQKAV